MFQFTITGGTAKKMTEGVDPGVVAAELEKLELEEQKGAGSATSRKKAGTPASATPNLLAPGVDRARRSAGGSGTPKPQGPRVIIIAQAKSYHKTGDQGHERTAKFTYKTGNTDILQMHLLQNYAKTVQDKPENQGVLVLPGYLVYGLVTEESHQRKGISWIPLPELLEKLEELKTGGIKEADLDQELSKHFIDKEIKKADNHKSKCWLEDILHDHFEEF
ncbi:hypothetical protein FRC14_002869 [Serendipita sp. 396]|nr:hypothetical protein FRC14_002869 [Serendipita sp. 396]KAG8785991.1 hypothetical protein FRC15_000312 [Serendipita sp. 397]KAG8824647.1 hypothetical protein FRC19_001328 [Serendipita sp. 401]KAG8832755.1 hypothetical protein FRC18_004596 [Serendipita sp. 400]KAG8867594.1 hypothetical protein FRC20_005377 [Serendipita sp. 405]KAG9054363.1 hypothetical protein FS842_005364 [Serendipita sp. 407]